ncbi:HSP20-like chaperone [Desarmillaria tabescens]|uniref:HSP20-like chaperone n=1 Tax=Armillaria tabescens TaxID=1929756 RepID=A0AA39TSH2_ARMTA|nr:HSP20-like chaperone [Desarmillaria tabescens]KAK0465013.1 HSP20-like chaperone [Desarmillaria tabescens]
MATHPEVLWAQRSSVTDEEKNIIYLTVNVPDIQPSTLECNLTPTSISFKTKAGNPEKGIPEKSYAFDLHFFEEIDPEKSLRRLNTRSLFLTLRKKEKKEEFWPRITKEKVRNAFLKTDFSKWVDEDEQDGVAVEAEDDMEAMGGMGGMPGMGGLPGMGGMGGMGGMPGMGGDMDIEKLMAQMGGGGAGPSGAADDGSDDGSDDDGPPPLEDAETAK